MAEVIKRLPAKLIDPHAGIVVNSLLANQAGAAKDAKVAAHGLRCQTDSRGNLTGAKRFLAKQVNNRLPRFIGESGQGFVDVGRHLVLGLIAQSLRNPPEVALDIGGAVCSVGPIVFAVVMHLWLVDNEGAIGLGVSTMAVDIVNEQ